MSGVPPPQNEIDRAAAEWVVRLAGSRTTPAERRAFEAWIAESKEHRAAFERAERTWADLGGLKDDPGSLRKVIAPAETALKPARKVVIAFALLGAGALTVGYLAGDPWIALVADHRTGVGEMRKVRLADGSTVQLDASTAISVQFGAGSRRVRLLAGAIYVEAVPRGDAGSRPFVVEAAHGETTAVGTRFAVEDVGDGATVVAIEHRIEVAAEGRDGGPVTLSPGETVRYDAVRGVGHVGRTDPKSAASWRTGHLIFQDAPLAEVVETLNRHQRERIVVVGAALASRRVSGAFTVDDLAGAVDVIAAELKSRAVSAPGLVTILY